MIDPLGAVAVVTVAYRSGDTLASMLRALPVERLADVVVVDNGDDAGDAAAVEEHGGGRARLLSGAGNIGFGPGNNRGARAANPSDWLLFLNPDAVLDAAQLETLVDYAREHPDAAVVGPRVFDGDVPLTSSGDLATLRTEIAHHGPPLLKRLGRQRRHPPDRSSSGPVGYVEGGCMLVDRSTFEAVGGFDEVLFLYYEECDLARRVGRVGRTVHLCATARVQHRPGTMDRATSFDVQCHLWRSAVIHLRTWQGAPAATALQLCLVVRLAAMVVGGRVAPSEVRSGLRSIRARGRRGPQG